ncbi:EF1D factor, partial [Mionectes macconnelli]|nr:EF1D factor [Mionectes macconnelli]
MRTRKNPCPADKAWPAQPESRESQREAAAPEGSQINGLCPDDSELRKSRNGRKQRRRKRSPKAKAAHSRPEFLLGMSAERVWFDKPLYDRAEDAYREKLLNSRGREAAEREFPAAPASEGLPAALPAGSHGNLSACSHGNLSACHHVLRGVWLNKLDFEKAEGAFMAKSRFSPGNAGPGAAGRGSVAALPAFAGSERAPANGKPRISDWEALLASEVWLEKPLYDSAERDFHERLFPGKRAGAERPRVPEGIPALFLLHRDSEAAWLHKPCYDRAECRFFSRAASENREAPAGNPSRAAAPAPGTKKMALDGFLHDKVWLEKHRYDDAERRFYERLNGPLGGPSRLQEDGASTILRDIARARENIQKSLEGSGGGAGAAGDQNELLARISHLETENQNLRGVVSDLQMALLRLESRLNALEKSSSGSHQPSPVPPTQKVEPFSIPSKKVELPARRSEAAQEEEDDDDIDLFGSDEEQDAEAAAERAERLRLYAQKKAGKPGIVAKSSILLDVKPWDDETDMGKLEECVRSVHMDGLLWGASKLVPVGYGIRKLQIQCVVEDEKVGTDILEEEITKFEDYVQSVDIAAFNKI